MSKRRPSSGGSFRNRREFFRKLSFEQVEDRRLLAAAPYQNAANPYDVNADGSADGTDLYLLDTELKARGERSLGNPNGPV